MNDSDAIILAPWKVGDAAANEGTLEAVRGLIKGGRRKQLLHNLKAWEPETILDLLVHLPLSTARKLFAWLPHDPSDRVLAELRPEFRAVITEGASIARLAEIIDRMPVETAAETVAALPDEVQREVAERLRYGAEILNAAHYGGDSAGRMMSRRLVALPATTTVAEAVAEIQQAAETVQYGICA
ncbi:hypothetical protein NUH88_05755 [Nisaea acidiphila]|uniref:Magnesium transporter MgtE intracellular domain-containing protein n=1 Tax=Nisaea acidiphila TaxID=1862145 RepID=A0A9J7AWM2_9PROT|nr:hypothetical protein [Nisaea acidiphila]UUX51194.1 hypothetical protein NUH88_05755 [Nisaea acidiphila]